MLTKRAVATLIAAYLAVPALAQPARADILISVDKSAQRMIVTVDGRPRYSWPVSTGKPGYDTPNGTFRAFRMDKDHRSDEWDDAPMPYSIFFTTTGAAVHGTYEERNLGRAVSHGCVRLSVENAATLWNLVKRQTMASTTVQISGAIARGRAATGDRGGLAPMTDVASAQDRPPGSRDRRRPLFSFFPSRPWSSRER